ncbi:hypothetical protein VTN00DRAFT_6337 [Thermoascus crustaceus]|uniref:uncharacterized protein n=1 Tax=Thermoascus crustaceus TaxID=5088 RepID=UPI0037421DF1
MEAIGAASAVIGIATAGIQTSMRLVTFAGQVKTAPSSISGIAEEISLTANILQQLGELMKQSVYPSSSSSDSNGDNTGERHPDESIPPPSEKENNGNALFSTTGLQTARALAFRCNELFGAVEHELRRASEQIRSRGLGAGGEKVKLSPTERLKWPFFQPRIQEVREELRETKSSLMILLQVTTLAYSRSVLQNASGKFNMNHSNAIVVPPDEQVFLVRSIVAAHKEKGKEGLDNDDDEGNETEDENEKENEDTNTPPPGCGDQSFGTMGFPGESHHNHNPGSSSRSPGQNKHPKSDQRPDELQQDGNPDADNTSEELLAAWEIHPSAIITGNTLLINHDRIRIHLEQWAIEERLRTWQSQSQSDTPLSTWEQWSSLTPSERGAFLRRAPAAETQTEHPLHNRTIIWVHTEEPEELVVGCPEIKGRSVCIVTKRKSQTQTSTEERSANVREPRGLKSANEGQSSSDNLGLLLERIRRRRQQMQFSGYRSADSPSAELAVTSCPYSTSGSDSDFSVELIERKRARARVVTKEEEVANKKEEGKGDAEKIVNDLMARYTTVFEK